MLEYYKNNQKDQLEPVEFLQWKEKINAPFVKENIGKYRKILSQAQLDRFTRIAYNELRSFDYI